MNSKYSNNHFVNKKSNFVEDISYLCHLKAEPFMIYLDKILTGSDLSLYLSYMIDKLGWGYHPDTPVSDYLDIYKISIAILNENFGDIFEEQHKAYSESNA